MNNVCLRLSLIFLVKKASEDETSRKLEIEQKVILLTAFGNRKNCVCMCLFV